VPDWGAVDRELRRKGVTRALLWEEYRAAYPEGYGYAWFCEHYEAWKGRVRPTMRQTHLGGDKVFIDFSGDGIEIVDPLTGEVSEARLFVAAMGASSYTYAEARPAETLEDWIGAQVNLFAFLGGVPRMVVPDNPRAVIVAPDRHEPGLNRTMAAMAEHYDVAVLPARPRKPRDKAKVEAAVLVAQRWIIARLRNRRFFSIAQVNAAIRPLLDEINTRIMRGYGASRADLFADLFATLDRPALSRLPEVPYVFARWSRPRVAPDYHVEIEGFFYSVPFGLIRETVEARATERTVEIFHRGRRIASHARGVGRRGGHVTDPAHMPRAHRLFAIRRSTWNQVPVDLAMARSPKWPASTLPADPAGRHRVPRQDAFHGQTGFHGHQAQTLRLGNIRSETGSAHRLGQSHRTDARRHRRHPARTGRQDQDQRDRAQSPWHRGPMAGSHSGA